MKLHRSQMTSAERARARQEAKVNAGTPNLQGTISFFHQAIADDCRQPETQFNAGMELNEGSFHHWGSDLDDVLK
jgi:hypothetical protein